MKVVTAILFLISCSNSLASIFRDDDRVNYHHFSSEMKTLSESSIALIHKHKMKKVGDFYEVKAKSLGDLWNFCKDANFSDEPQAANCSGALISADHILTAAHCVTDSMKGYGMNDFFVVFNYKKTSPKQKKYLISSRDVFTMSKKVHHEFNMSTNWNDLAIYKLDRPAGYKPAELDYSQINIGDKIHMLGYPLGVPLKLSSDSQVTSVGDYPNSFRHQLDSFSVNSGSPIYNSSNKIIGLLVRGTGANYNEVGRGCNDWDIGDVDKDFGAGNILNSIKSIVQNLK